MGCEEDRPEDKSESPEKTGRAVEPEKAGKEDPEFSAQMEVAREIMRVNRETLRRLADS